MVVNSSEGTQASTTTRKRPQGNLTKTGSTRIHPSSHSEYDNKIDPSLGNVPHLNPHNNVTTTNNSRLEIIGISCTLYVKVKKGQI